MYSNLKKRIKKGDRGNNIRLGSVTPLKGNDEI
jgi:hypothetical protein